MKTQSIYEIGLDPSWINQLFEFYEKAYGSCNKQDMLEEIEDAQENGNDYFDQYLQQTNALPNDVEFTF